VFSEFVLVDKGVGIRSPLTFLLIGDRTLCLDAIALVFLLIGDRTLP